LWNRSTEANTRVIVAHNMVSRGGILALSTTSGQGAGIPLEIVGNYGFGMERLIAVTMMEVGPCADVVVVILTNCRLSGLAYRGPHLGTC
jgi:hypothetical protein